MTSLQVLERTVPKKILDNKFMNIFQPIRVKDWSSNCPVISGNQLCEDQLSLFRQNKDLICVVICDERHRPIGLLMKDRFFGLVGSLYGMSLYRNRTIADLMDKQPLVIEVSIDPKELIDQALSRDEATFYNPVLLTEQGKFVGILTVNNLLNVSRMLQREAVSHQMRIIQDTAQMIDDVHQSVAKVAETSIETKACSEKIAEVTTTGRRELEGTLQLFHLWSEHANRQKNAMIALTERTTAVDGIIRIIANLADQCNLLAVNATIEAARAGEHGKGFGVVASEIRTLADQTKQSTAQITGLIKSMTDAVKGASLLAGEGKQGADQGFAQINKTEDTFNQLWRSSESNHDSALRLKAASSEAMKISSSIRLEFQKLANQLTK
jgi:methyl-accepting chemotaxis protein